MKLIQSLALGALALASLVPASAQTTIRFAASNGDRNATQAAITKIFDAGTAWSYRGLSGSVTYNGTTITSGALADVTGSNFGTFNGTYQGQNVIIKTNYAGALAGIAAVASSPQIAQRFDPTNGTGAGAIPANPITTTNPANYVEAVVDFGLSTNFQSTSPFNGVYNGHTYVPIKERIVGVSPLGFYASPGFPADNITTQQAQLLYSTGSVPLSIFTGDWTAGDQNKIVYAIGRNTDAGQRFGAVGEIGFGTTGPVTHWQPLTNTAFTTGTGGILYGAVVNTHQVWPSETLSGIPSPGSSGFSSGALVAQWLTVTLASDAYRGKFTFQDEEGNTVTDYLYPNATAGYYIGYVTPGDGNPRILGLTADGTADAGIIPLANRGKKLKYNGVDNTSANVRNGQYTVWLYNRILTPLAGLPAGLKANYVESLRTQIKDVDATAGGGVIHKPAPFATPFNVKRDTDGGPVKPGYKLD